MSSTAKKSAKSAAKKTKTSARRKLTSTARLPLDAKIVVSKTVEKPEFREGTAVARRVAAVLASNGKPVEAALKRGARTSTVRYLEKSNVIRLITK
jgi:hypothetical protein